MAGLAVAGPYDAATARLVIRTLASLGPSAGPQRAIIAANLALSVGSAASFWPQAVATPA